MWRGKNIPWSRNKMKMESNLDDKKNSGKILLNIMQRRR
jgi:hypothetical protein